VKEPANVQASGPATASPAADQDHDALDAELRGFLALVLADGGMRELRALDVVRSVYPYKGEHTETGYFKPDDAEKAVASARHFRGSPGSTIPGLSELSWLRSVAGVYYSINPIKPAAYGKAPSRLVKAKRGETAGDADVERRTILLVDIDAPREVNGVPATDEEKARALALKTRVREFLDTRDWPKPIEVDSGNGVQLLYRIDLPADDGLVFRVLAGLAAKFADDDAKIDRSVHNAARIARLPCTWNRKAQPTPGRPHRMARVLELPEVFDAVAQGQLQAIAALAPEPGTRAPRRRASARTRAHASVEEAVRRWNDDHPRAWPTECSECLICGSPDGLKASTGAAGRWCCFSSRHALLADRRSPDDGIGVPGTGCYTGDALDVEAFTTDRTRVQVLRDDGYLPEPSRAPADERSQSADDGREEIVFHDADRGYVPLHQLVPQAVALLAQRAPESIYVHAEGLAHVIVDNESSQELRRSAAPRIRQLLSAALRERLDAVARWNHYGYDQHGNLKVRERWCPREVVDALLQRGCWPSIRPLQGVTTAPVLRVDGTILSAPGYDAATQLLYAPSCAYPPVSWEPSTAEIGDALEALTTPFEDFPSESPADRAALLSFMLTIAARAAIDGPVPMTVVTSPTPGTGKTLLIEAATTAMTGHSPDKLMVPGGRASDADAEWRKRIATIAMESPRAVLIDNLPNGGTLQTPALASALTSTEVADRLLGQNRIVHVPHRVVWCATGNNVTVDTDLARRSLSIRLDARVESPHLRDRFRISNLLEYVCAEHPRMLTSALTVLRGFAVAGRPQHSGATLGMFEAWDRLIRSCVVWALSTDPLATQDRLRGQSPETSTLGALLRAWHADLGEDPVHAADLLRRPALSDVLAEACPAKGRDSPTAVALGRYLGRYCDRVVSGLRLGRAGSPGGKVLWSVRAVAEAT
jgi:hypothetical protein